MANLASTSLDISQLPPFQLVTVDYEAERTNIVNGIVARFQARGVDYDVQSIETDSAVILAEEFAYRKTLSLAALNDAGKRLTVAYGYGAALDHLAATYYADIGVRRLPLVGLANPRPYTEYPEDWESDDAFRERIVLAPDARSPFTPGAYAYAARSTSTDVVDAVALNFSSGKVARRGDVLVVILGREGVDETDLCAKVQAALAARDIQAETDTVMVRAATRTPIAIARTVEVLRGPDEALVKAKALAGVEAYRQARRKIGRIFAVSGVDAATHVGGVETVLPGLPAADVDPGLDGVVEVTSVDIETAVLNG